VLKVNFIIYELIIQNFLSIGKVIIKFSNQGTVLIQGMVEGSSASESNGAGKSTIIEALCWVLFDDTLKGISKDNIINNYIGKDCFVSIKGSLNGISYEITRYRKHSEFKNRIVFLYNNIDISEASDTKTNEKIESVLKMNFQDFQTNIIFSSDSMKFLELGDTERKKIFDGIVKSDLYENCIDKIKEKIKEKEDELSKLDLEKSKIEYSLDFQKKQIESYQKNSIEFESNNKNQLEVYEKEKNNLKELLIIEQNKKCDVLESKDFLINSNILLHQQDDKISEKMKEINENHEELNIQKQKDDIQKNVECEPLLKFIKDNNDILINKRIESNKIQISIKYNKEQLEKSLIFLNELNNKLKVFTDGRDKNLCPLCNQPLSDRHNIQKELDNINEKINECEKLNKSFENFINEDEKKLEAIVNEGKNLKLLIEEKQLELDNKNKSISSLLEKLNEKQDIVRRELNLKFSNLLAERSNLKKQIDINIEKSNTINEFSSKQALEIQKINSKIEEIYSKIQQIGVAVNVFISKIEETKNEIIKLNMDFKLNEKKILDLNVNSYKYWINGFKKIKGLLISTITPMMNEKAQEYSQLLTGSEFDIKFITQHLNKDGTMKDVFEIEVSRQNGGNNYKSLSSGEKRRVDLIVIFVLDELKRLNCMHNFNVRFYDEIFDSLDSIGKERVMNLLNTISENKELYVISHQSDLRDLFNKSITLIKKNGISEILNTKIPIENTIII
jgi:DNA repair exonuclease SbcCD ATPase subunit